MSPHEYTSNLDTTENPMDMSTFQICVEWLSQPQNQESLVNWCLIGSMIALGILTTYIHDLGNEANQEATILEKRLTALDGRDYTDKLQRHDDLIEKAIRYWKWSWNTQVFNGLTGSTILTAWFLGLYEIHWEALAVCVLVPAISFFICKFTR